METTDKTVEQAVESLLAPEKPEVEDAEVIEETQSEDEEAETEEAPLEEETDEDEAETDEDDAEIDGDDVDQEDEDETDSAAEEEQSDSHTVKVDGEEKTVTLDELKRGYAGQAYIQKQMREVAEARKAAQSEAEQARQDRAMLAHLVQSAQQGGLTPPKEPDPAKFQEDPIGFMEDKLAYDQAKAQYDQNMQALQYQQYQQTEQQRQQQMQFLQEQAELLKQEIPEFADPEAGGKLRAELRQTGAHYGFSDEEVAGVQDARMVKVLNDARKWRELQASKDQVKEKAKKARPVVKPGAKKRTDAASVARKKQRERFNKTHSLEDAAALLLDP